MRFMLLLGLLTSCRAFSNDATELFPGGGGDTGGGSSSTDPEQQLHHGNMSMLNRARTGGRGANVGARDRSADEGQIGCRELRSTKYISDGHCTSIKPIKELVCAGECLPAQLLPNWIGAAHGSRPWGRKTGLRTQDWRCVNDKTRTQRIQLLCQDGSSRTYKITVVTSCKCKRYSRQHNQSESKFREEEAMSSPHFLHKHQVKSKRRSGKKRFTDNWHEP